MGRASAAAKPSRPPLRPSPAGFIEPDIVTLEGSTGRPVVVVAIIGPEVLGAFAPISSAERLGLHSSNGAATPLTSAEAAEVPPVHWVGCLHEALLRSRAPRPCHAGAACRLPRAHCIPPRHPSAAVYAWALRLLRRPAQPISPMPVANNGKAAGSGVTPVLLGMKS
jgi:hypothetical protein